MNSMNLFVSIIMIQLFYAFSITALAYGLPTEQIHYVSQFSTGANLNMENMSSTIRNSIDDQLNIPVIELGALVFYSGNILLDLMLNFFFAVPQMIVLLCSGIMQLFNISSQVIAMVQLFGTICFSVMYFLGIIQLLINVRSTGKVI